MPDAALQLVHYSAAPFALDRTRTYPYADAPLPAFKPHGLWCSVESYDDDQTWHSWCVGEEFHLDALRYHTEVVLVPGANVLHLDDEPALRAFGAEFRDPAAPDVLRAIDWPRVAATYAGIVIAPYQWTARYDLFWYYAWDCASACLWDLQVIA